MLPESLTRASGRMSAPLHDQINNISSTAHARVVPKRVGGGEIGTSLIRSTVFMA